LGKSRGLKNATTMNIIKIPLQFVNLALRSKLFWAVVCGLVLLLWLTKLDFSKIVKIIKLLGKLGANLFALFLSLTLSPFIKVFQEAEET